MFEQALKSGEDLAETSEGLRIGKDLIKATVPFAEVSVRRSWWHVGTTFAINHFEPGSFVQDTRVGIRPWKEASG